MDVTLAKANTHKSKHSSVGTYLERTSSGKKHVYHICCIRMDFNDLVSFMKTKYCNQLGLVFVSS